MEQRSSHRVATSFRKGSCGKSTVALRKEQCSDQRNFFEADEPDEAALKGILKKLKTEADYAFEPDPADTTTAKAVRENSRTKYGLEMKGAEPSGGGRAERNKGGDGTIVTAEMRADPKFMLDPRNKEIIRDAAIGGRFR